MANSKSGGTNMEFLADLIATLVKMAIVIAFSFGGVMLGKKLREKKDKKELE